jgi:hypothetical protein
MIFCRELNQEFASQKELFTALKANMTRIKQAKKATIKHSDGLEIIAGKTTTSKAEGQTERLKYGDKVYPVINTTKVLDSHMDVHLDGIWNKSAQEQAGKVALIINHDYKIGQVIAYPEDVVPMVKVMDWKDLGREWEGQTEALIFESTIKEDANDIAFKAYQNRRAVQHSVCMEYVKFEMAVNSDDEDWAQERANWEKYLPIIANPEKAIKFGYFWAVAEAKIYREGSMVLLGSNDVTPTLYDYNGAEKITPKQEPTSVTPERMQELNKLINILKS